jgi:hypothetical protein
VIIDCLEAQVNVAFLCVHAHDLEHETLLLTDVVANTLHPAGGDFTDVREAFLVLVFVQCDEGAEVLHLGDGADDQLAFFGEFSEFRHVNSLATQGTMINGLVNQCFDLFTKMDFKLESKQFPMSAYGPLGEDIWWRGLPALGVFGFTVAFAGILTGDIFGNSLTIGGDFGTAISSDKFGKAFLVAFFVIAPLAFAIPVVWGWPPISRLASRTGIGLLVYLVGAILIVLALMIEIVTFTDGVWKIIGGLLLLILIAFPMLGLPAMALIAMIELGRECTLRVWPILGQRIRSGLENQKQKEG